MRVLKRCTLSAGTNPPYSVDMIHIFTYGSLMFNPVWSTVVTGTYEHCPARLPGFVRRSIRGEDYPAIIADRLAATVDGVLYLGVDRDDLARLDAFEGTIYFRQQVQVRTADNLFAAETYVLGNAYRHLLGDEPWRPEAFEKTGIHRFLDSYHGFKR